MQIIFDKINSGTNAKNCTTCHDGNFAFLFPARNSESAWVPTFVTPGQSANSLIYRALYGSGITGASMPKSPWTPLSATDLNTIKNWIDTMPVPTPTPTPGPSGTPAPTSPPSTSSTSFTPGAVGINARLGDRFFVASVLNDIFSGDVAKTAEGITNSLALTALNKLGGPCDPMAADPYHLVSHGTVNTPSYVAAKPNYCATNQSALVVDSPSGTSALSISATTPRLGQVLKICNVLAYNDITLQNAIKKATQKTDLSYLNSNPIPTSTEIIKAYGLFMTGTTPPLAVITALSAVAVAAQEPASSVMLNKQLEPWRYLFLTLCYAPDWQVP